MKRVPALIVSGWLGSGKTTLVGHLLDYARAHGKKLAIVSNEFGDTGIDRALLDAGQDGFVELDGGCVCCKLSDALPETLEAILTQVEPDWLVLETSGVALPGEILIQFWRPPIRDMVTDELVAVAVDVARYAELREDHTFAQQLDAADLILLNKVDLVDDATLREAEAGLTETTGGRPMVRCLFSRVEPGILFPDVGAPLRADRRDETAELHAHTHDRFSTRELSFPDVYEPADIIARVQAFGAVRAKGFVRTPAGIKVIQGVGNRITLDELRVEPPESLIGKVVLISREAGHEHH